MARTKKDPHDSQDWREEFTKEEHDGAVRVLKHYTSPLFAVLYLRRRIGFLEEMNRRQGLERDKAMEEMRKAMEANIPNE